MEYTQTNHVILAQTNGRMCLKETLETLGYGKYKPTVYSALTQRFTNPKATTMIFSTGNITSMGCKCLFDSLFVLYKLKKRLGLEFVNIRLSNIVVTFSIQSFGKLDLTKFYNDNQSQSTYDVEIFPCLTFNLPDSKIKANIFNTGKVVLIGCRNNEQIEHSIRIIVERVKNSIS